MELVAFHKIIPTWDNGTWTTTEFTNIEDFRTYVKGLFKEPGQYDFDETSELFNEQARLFWQNGESYNFDLFMSRGFLNYWDGEKAKCRNGAIFKSGDKEWYLPRDYYMWINFLPIYDKIKKKYDFAQVWDVQYHIALYELLAEIHYKHASIFKKRQIASSYFHMAKLINQIWFEEGAILKIGASLKDYINLKGSWKFLNEYRSFLNSKTAWKRQMNPGKVLEWQQKIEVDTANGTEDVGLKGMISGMSFEQNATNGVGGPCTYFFYEEAGIAPTMDETAEYLFPAMQAGDITTGMFIAAGSVGKLDDAGPLKDFTLHPDDNNIYAVETNLLDEKGTVGRSGLFIPEQWGMPPYIDKYGNSEVERALEALEIRNADAKKKLKPELYQLRVSQHPRNIKEGFAYREESKFPLHIVGHQKNRIEEKEFPAEFVELTMLPTGELKVSKSNKVPISEFPIKKNTVDKTGTIVVWERPDPKPEFAQYIASIDPVGEGKTTTSESLCSIYVYKTATHVKRYTEEGVENFIEGDKVVASWCGRFDDINKTHERLLLIIEWYNAWTIVENNVSLFIQYMIKERKQRYLVPKNQMIFLKEVQANKTVYSDYGWKNTGTLFKVHLLNYLIEYVSEVVDEDLNEDGTTKRKHFGVQRIPDIMAMVEMENYQEGVNVDRLVSLAALIALVKGRESNVSKPVRVENEIEDNLQNTENFHKLKSSAFRNIGRKRGSGNNSKPRRSPFKRIR